MAEIKRVGVVGAGLMGHGIAQVAAEAGYDVVLRDVDERFVAKGRAAIATQLRNAVEKGRGTQEDADAALARVTGTTDLAALADRDIVVEAIPEVLEVKRSLWSELDGVAAEHTIFATNTSALSVIDQAAVTQRPDRFVGLHFVSPVQRMALVEVVRAITTSDETMAAADAAQARRRRLARSQDRHGLPRLVGRDSGAEPRRRPVGARAGALRRPRR